MPVWTLKKPTRKKSPNFYTLTTKLPKSIIPGLKSDAGYDLATASTKWPRCHVKLRACDGQGRGRTVSRTHFFVSIRGEFGRHGKPDLPPRQHDPPRHEFAEARQIAGISETLIRLSVGLEHSSDQLAELSHLISKPVQSIEYIMTSSSNSTGTQVHEQSRLRISFEFFPPKTDKMQENLWASIKKLKTLVPDFVSVTYGAGGSTRERTHETVANIVNRTNINAAAHLTCVGSTKSEIDNIARAYWDVGVRHIVALRGDPAAGIGAGYIPTPNGYAYSNDLIEGLRNVAPFDISVSAYPERHPESKNWQVEIDNLEAQN